MDQAELDEQERFDRRQALEAERNRLFRDMQSQRDVALARESTLHYAIRTTANILDKKTADESQAECLKLVAKMHAVWEAAHEVDKAYSRNEQHPGERDGALEAMRVVLDAPVSSFGPK